MTARNAERKQQHDKLNFSDSCVIDLGNDLDIRKVEALHSQLSKLHADSFLLDASATRRVDACGLQLITAFIRHAISEGRTVEWLSPHENLVYAAGLLGLSESMQLTKF